MEHLKQAISREHLIWALGSICQLHRIPFSPELVVNQFAPPYSLDTWLHAAASLKFKATDRHVRADHLHALVLPCVAVLRSQERTAEISPEDVSAANALAQSVAQQSTADADGATPDVAPLALVLKADKERILCFEPGNDNAKVWAIEEFEERFSGRVLLATPEQPAPDDAGSVEAPKKFGFRWFLPELLKHKKVWREVLLASLVIQLMALATPLFTQVIIDKVIAHHSINTLVVIGIALVVFMGFTAVLSWVRQYLILHTGNRVDAVLATQVFEHLFRLPPRYFDFRPTGTLISRVQGVETIREFITGAAVTLLLDFPFLLIFLAVMFYYSWLLSVIALGLLLVIAGLSLAITPVLRARLNKQFMLGARNQAFLTEYVSGMETVKSLQMEPQLGSRYGNYMASYVEASFNARQLSNTYNVVASTLEQLMTLTILCVGAWMAMTRNDFTIGMLVAFQMFASRLSGPMLRMVGLWQQLQQTNIAVERLGDIINAPTEPYSLVPSRDMRAHGKVEIQRIGFRYGDDLPFLYRDLSLTLERGKCVALMGPSGSGKSTLAKLLQGFYLPQEGRILLDGRDIRHLGANELRRNFGVVPQETVLFSGTIYDNLVLANPHATFEQVVEACRLAEIHEVIEQLPEGYQSKVGEHGAGLSGGQKQRIAIARALLKRPKILIFDEATSGLDQVTAEHFAVTINRLKGKVTMLFITHQIPKGLKLDEVVSLGNHVAEKPAERRPRAQVEDLVES